MVDAVLAIKYTDNTSKSKIKVTFGSDVLSSRVTTGHEYISGAGLTEVFECNQDDCGYFQITVSTIILNFEYINIYYEGESDNNYSFDVTSHGYEATTPITDVTDTLFNDNKGGRIEASYDKASGSTAPAYYVSGTAYRLYAKNTITITSTKANLVSLKIIFRNYYDGTNDIVASVGDFEDDTWTCEEPVSEVVFTIGGTKGHRKIAGFDVTYYDANLFASDFLNNASCYGGLIVPSVDGWSKMANIYSNSLFIDDQNALKSASPDEYGSTIEQALARYQAIQSNYSHSTYSDFLNLNISNSRLTFSIVDHNNALVPAIVIISLIGVGALTIIYHRRKATKEHY